jgi:predicted esterase
METGVSIFGLCMHVLHVRAPTTGRILNEDPAGSVEARGLLVGCHGYGQDADAMLEELRRIPGRQSWRLVSVQALHPFYTRNNERVVASWMTRQDREHAIADNIEYMNRTIDAVSRGDAGADAGPIVFVGFSQGASMAARAAVRGRHVAAGLVMLGGDIPPDVREAADVAWPRVLIGVGSRDDWYGARVDSDVAFLAGRGITHELVRFDGGHEFTDEFRRALGGWLVALLTGRGEIGR